MKRPSFRSLMTLAIALIALFAGGSDSYPARAVSDEVKPILAMIDGQIDGGQVYGAGIILGVQADRLYIVTANHVVRKGVHEIENLRVQLKSLPGEPLEAKLLTSVDRELDIAVLSVVGVGRNAIPVKQIPFDQIGTPTDLFEGDEAYMIGYPNHRAWKAFVTPALISEISEVEINFESQAVEAGLSGGGLYNRESELIGMITAYVGPDTIAVRIDKVLRLAESWGYPVQLAPSDGVQPNQPTPIETLDECAHCPGMVTIAPGSFRMGSDTNDPDANRSEFPQHHVHIDSAFEISKYEVTFEEYDTFAEATNRDLPPDNGSGRGRRPVINVSWYNAKAYARWLSRQTGKMFRLPTEAEWEYAARAGTVTRYPWGDSISHENANWCGSLCQDLDYDDGDKWIEETAPVGEYDANGFGLFDMHGNVWEWIEDCYNRNYNDATSDGAALAVEECDTRVLRGGSWNSHPSKLRSAGRAKTTPDNRKPYIGFRLARTL